MINQLESRSPINANIVLFVGHPKKIKNATCFVTVHAHFLVERHGCDIRTWRKISPQIWILSYRHASWMLLVQWWKYHVCSYTHVWWIDRSLHNLFCSFFPQCLLVVFCCCFPICGLGLMNYLEPCLIVDIACLTVSLSILWPIFLPGKDGGQGQKGGNLQMVGGIQALIPIAELKPFVLKVSH